MRIIKFSLIAMAFVIAFSMPGSAQGMMGGGYGPGMMGGYYYGRSDYLEKSEPVKTVLSKIRKEQGLKEGETINPDRVSPKLLGELGDTVMDAIIGNKETHEWMDNMMGGEGSPSLESMHEWMGYRYLTGQPLGMMGPGYGRGMMGGGNYGMQGYGGMMGYYGGFYGYNPYMPMMSFGSFLGTGTLMDMNMTLDYRFANYLGLTKEQVREITDLKLEYEKETDTVRAKLLEERRNLFNLWSSADIDEKAIKDTDDKVLKLFTTLYESGTDYRIKVLGLLTPEQRKKLSTGGMMNFQNLYTNR